MNWTVEKPTQPGFYWYHRISTCKPVVIEVKRDRDGALRYDGWDVRYHHGKWAGPIPKPPEDEK